MKYLKAAKLLDKNTFACPSINEAAKTSQEAYDLLKEFDYYFRPSELPYTSTWFGDHREEKNQLARSLALLLMHEITS